MAGLRSEVMSDTASMVTASVAPSNYSMLQASNEAKAMLIDEVAKNEPASPPPSVPFIRPASLHKDLTHFGNEQVHAVRLVEKLDTRMLKGLFPTSPLRVAVLSAKSLFICDTSGPVKRLIKLSHISQIYTQTIEDKSGNGVQHILLKLPTEHDILLVLISDPRNQKGDFVAILTAVWAVDRYRRLGDRPILPVFEIDSGRIWDQKYAQLKDHSLDGTSKQNCKSCMAKDKELEWNQEQLFKLFTKVVNNSDEAVKVKSLEQVVEKLKEMTAEANAGRDAYKAKARKLMLCVDNLNNELEEWRSFSETLVKQAQQANIPSEIPTLCHPRRVAQLEWRLEQAEAYKQAYTDLKARYDADIVVQRSDYDRGENDSSSALSPSDPGLRTVQRLNDQSLRLLQGIE